MLTDFASSVEKRIRLNRTRLFSAASTAILAAVAFTLASVAANDAIHPRSSQAQTSRAASTLAQANKTYTLYSGLWRTDGSFVATIRIKNVLAVAPMDVTPVLFMADGSPYMLSSVHIAVSGVATVNINDALAAAPSSIASHVSQFGNAALIYSYPSPGHVTAQVAAIDASRSLSYVFPFVQPMNMQHDGSKQVLEGLWWKHDRGVRGFVSVSNSTDEPQTVNLRSIGIHEYREDSESREVDVAAHSTRMLQLEDLGAKVAEGGNRAGGIRVEYEGSQGAILVTGGLANESEGYSANMPFWTHNLDSSSPTKISMASVGIMVGKPDPMMMPGFLKETTFSPYLVLRNTTEKPLDVSLQLNYMMGMGDSSPLTRNLPPQHLGPFEARQVDMQAALNSAGLKSFNGSINLSTSFTGKGGDLVLATGSVDQTGTYVFEVEPQGVGSSKSKFANYWGVANGNDTMFSLWNPTDAPQDIVATFYYGNGSGKYLLPVHLEAQASTMIDMAMLIAELKPDADGNIIPPSIQEGSADFASAKGRNEKITLVIAAGIYNVSTATCGSGCITCCGTNNNFTIAPSPFYCPVGQSMPISSNAVDCNGFTIWPNLTSSNSSVVTVDNVPNAHGVSAGQATIYADWGEQIQGGPGTYQICGGPQSCPFYPQQSQCTANVTPTATVSCTPTTLALGPTAPSNTTNGSCGATVNPAGGAFIWSVVTSTSPVPVTITPNGSTVSYTSANPSATFGDTAIKLVYTVNQQSVNTQSQLPLTVVKPTALKVLSDTTNPTGRSCSVTSLAHPGDGTCNATSATTNYSSYLRTRQYSVLDQFNPADEFVNIGITNATVTETVPYTTTCPNLSFTPGAATSTTFPDSFYLCHTCCAPGGPGCSADTNPQQTIFVNGIAVRTENIHWTCSSVNLTP